MRAGNDGTERGGHGCRRTRWRRMARPAVAARVARGAGRPAGRRHLPGLPRVGRRLGQARAAGIGRGARHGRARSLARGRDPGAAAPGEAAAAPLDRSPRLMIVTGRRDEWIVRLPAAACAPRHGRPGLRPGPADGRPAARPGLGADPLLLGPLRGRDAPGGQRRAAGVLHHAGALRGLAASSNTTGRASRDGPGRPDLAADPVLTRRWGWASCRRARSS